MTGLNLISTKVNGNIGDLKTLTALTTLNLSNTQVSGNTGDLKTLTALANLKVYNSQVSGNIGDLKTLTALTILNLANTQVSGNIGSLSSLTKLKDLNLGKLKVTGDLANLPASCRFVSVNNVEGSSFTWGERASSSKILAINGDALIDNVDKMLQDQAKCQVGFTSSDGNNYKIIACSGTRTSASDDAVATLQQKGYTISIANA